jgi:hypothetical protein
MSLREVLERGQRVRLLSVEKGITIGKNENFLAPIMADQTREWKKFSLKQNTDLTS